MRSGDAVSSGVAKTHRASSEDLHHKGSSRGHANMQMLWKTGYADLIRGDHYALLDVPPEATGTLLEAGCGTGIETTNLRRIAPNLLVHAVDISGVALTQAVQNNRDPRVEFNQSSLDCLPYRDASFDYLSMHEVIEHVEDPAVTLQELFRVLTPAAVGAIATPNGASLFPEHIRQRLVRLFGGRGAPIGEDHVRPPSYWRRQFRKAGFIVERQMFDASAIELQTYILPASWMPWTSRLLEPLRIVPGINLLICDRVKFRIRKPGRLPHAPVSLTSCCPICHTDLNRTARGAVCGKGHSFSRSPATGLMDFTATMESPGGGVQPAKAPGSRAMRRLFLGGALLVYICLVACLLPLGWLMWRFDDPFLGVPRNAGPGVSSEPC